MRLRGGLMMLAVLLRVSELPLGGGMEVEGRGIKRSLVESRNFPHMYGVAFPGYVAFFSLRVQ